MGFWGVEVKPGKPYPYQSDAFPKLHITQATLGLGESKERSVVQCSLGEESPIFLCSLLPNKNESCPLNLEFEGTSDGLVTFSVIGKRSVHLSGYFVDDDRDVDGDESDDYALDAFGEDIADTESDSSDYDTDDDYEDEFMDDEDLNIYPPSPVPNSGVIIEEIEDEEKPTNGNSQSKRLLKKNKSSDADHNTNSQHQIVVKKSGGVPVLESEDEDGFPISTNQKSNSNTEKPEAATEHKDDKITEKTKKKKVKEGDDAARLKRKVEDVDQDGQPERQKKNKKKKKLKEQDKEGNADEINGDTDKEKQPENEQKLSNKKSSDINMDSIPGETQTEEKKKKKKKKSQESERKPDMDQTVANGEDQKEPTLNQTNGKPSKVRTFGNGLVIEELEMGRPDGKRASPGQKVSIRYIGKLKNGKIFDSNVGGPPFKFRLGVKQAIMGMDVGVNGMRIGDKRRLTIPPAMGYGHKGAGKIPPNAWLVFDVELVAVH